MPSPDYALILKRQCIINLFLQSKSARFYNAINTCMVVPNILIGGVLSVSIFSTSSSYWRTSTGVLAIVSTALSSLAKHIGAGERAQLHCAMVRQYSSIIQDIDMYLHGAPDADFIDRIRHQLGRLFDLQPQPSYFAVRQYEHKYKKDIEMAMFDEFEAVAMQNASYVAMRLSRIRDQVKLNDLRIPGPVVGDDAGNMRVASS